MKKTQKGFIALYFTLLVVSVLSGIGVSAFALTSSQQNIIQNTKASLQAYYGAEAGVEDALFRVKNLLQWSNPGTLTSLNAQVGIDITGEGSKRTVVAQGNDSSRIRKVQAVYQLSGIAPQFFYGAHVGENGLQMDNNSSVVGNVFTNGGVQGNSGAIITDTMTMAGIENQLQDVHVQGDAFTYACVDAEVDGTLHTNSNDNCSFGAIETLETPLDSAPLPLSEEDIQGFKNTAEAGGVIYGSYELDGTDSATLGSRKIVGDLVVEDKAILTLTGTLWVTGNVDIKNEGQVHLDASFGYSSGVIVADGIIVLQNNSISQGSGTQGSYLMYLSTNTGNPAVQAKNNTVADILYASLGWVLVENNNELHEVIGEGVHLKNNAVITYESGIVSSTFSSGPGADWEVSSWKEVE